MFAQARGKDQEKFRLINLLASYGVREPVLSAFEKVPREHFVDPRFSLSAYEDRPIYIGHGQTTSQPSLIALMLQSLELKGGEKVLEIGTGSGFQTALLAELAGKVHSIEKVPGLASLAKSRIKKLGIKNAQVVVGDGTKGLPRNAPYDAIIVTAYVNSVPPPFVKQLKEGGKLIIPVGEERLQYVNLYKKQKGKLKLIEKGVAVVFVPLTGKHGVKE